MLVFLEGGVCLCVLCVCVLQTSSNMFIEYVSLSVCVSLHAHVEAFNCKNWCVDEAS